MLGFEEEELSKSGVFCNGDCATARERLCAMVHVE